MVQIYCPNCIHQLWGLGRESGGASQSLLGERGWVQDTHPHGPGDRCPLPPHPPCKSTLLPQASGAEIPPPAPGAAALPWGAVGCGWTLGWCQLGYRGVCNSLSPNSPPPPGSGCDRSVPAAPVSLLSHNTGVPQSSNTQQSFG